MLGNVLTIGMPSETNCQVELFDYGIEVEQSDIRAHVGPATRRVYVFRTAEARKLAAMGKYDIAAAFQPGVDGPTATGWKIPVGDFRGIFTLRWDALQWWTWFSKDSPTNEKGRHAVRVVTELLKAGRFPLWVDCDENDRTRLQLKGTDILLYGKWRIQVKCDWSAGPRELGGTGNVFIQKAERNPLKKW